MQEDKKSFRFLRAAKIFLIAYFGIATLAATFSLSIGWHTLGLLGSAFLYVGIAGSAIGFIALMGTGGHLGGSIGPSPYFRDDSYFKKARSVDKPAEEIILPIILASVLLAATGYLVILFFA